MLVFASSLPGLRATPAASGLAAEPVWRPETALPHGPALWLSRRISPAASASAVRALARLLRAYVEGPAAPAGKPGVTTTA
ncbi:hypothetical protein [Hymenobacter sp. CRA2]|uniref:hypothetical protein n=1 Tax=Hymenobacter sp. CRA2 TaxID=1955620 RepID=UPI0011174D70|nr:hypothetical protein [Hymenobacter sp. CRA2]